MNFNEFLTQLLIYSTGLGLAVFLGGIVPTFRRWEKRHFPSLLSFSAGILLGSTFLHLIPEAIKLSGETSSYFILLGFLFLYFIEKFVTVHVCEALECEVHKIGISAFIGLSIHALTAGLALGLGMQVVGLGLVIFLGLFVHKAPEAFSLTAVLMHAHFKRSKIMLLNFLLWLMVPLGALLSYYFMKDLDTQYLGMALSFSAGTFIEVCLTDLIPEVHKQSTKKYKVLFFFSLGLFIMFFFQKVLGHAH